MLCVAVGSILPLLCPGINSTFPPSNSRPAISQTAQPTALLLGRAQLLLPQPTGGYTSLASKTELQKAPNTFSVLTVLWNLPSCCYTYLPSLYYLYQCTSVSHWTLVPSSLLWNNLLEPLIYGLLLFWVSLHNTKATKLGKSKGLSKCFSSTFKSVMNSFISVLQM